VTLKEAAAILGVSKEAVRKRVIRNTLRSDTGEDGRRYVYLDDVGDEPPTHEPDALISAKDETIATLREQLEAERQAHAEARRIIAGLVERIPPAIEARESPLRDSGPGPTRTPTNPDAGAHSEAQAAQRPERREPGWWRRLFGG